MEAGVRCQNGFNVTMPIQTETLIQMETIANVDKGKKKRIIIFLERFRNVKKYLHMYS